jgi:hypothetical protein
MIDKDVNSPVRFRAHEFRADGLRRFTAGTRCATAGVREIRNSLLLKSFRLPDRQYDDGVREIEMTR